MPDQVMIITSAKLSGAPSWMGFLRPASQTMVNQMRRTRIATSATRAPSAKRPAVREGSAVAMMLLACRPMRPKATPVMSSSIICQKEAEERRSSASSAAMYLVLVNWIAPMTTAITPEACTLSAAR
ncbi:Uncharacterised protein [Mycobacterium tuberculosis]|nr:Uncharacterised protein [Mycobacterium tuberculosis]